MKLFLTAIGKRVQLIKYLKRQFEVVGADCSSLAPAIHFVDKFYRVPPYSQESYKQEILDICRNEKVDILVSVFEQEFYLLDSIRDKLKEISTFLILPSRQVLEICDDKWETYKFFKSFGIDTPQSFLSFDECPVQYPLFIKPRVGMGSKNSIKVNNKEELRFYFNRTVNPIIQEFIEGIEYTVDCMCDENGRAVSIVPRERIEVRAGEVSKSRTCRDELIIEKTRYICEKLGALGPITIQGIKTLDGSLRFIEINPRMGGGVPLAFEAGADYCRYFKDLAAGKALNSGIGNFRELTMLRYDEAVFI